MWKFRLITSGETDLDLWIERSLVQCDTMKKHIEVALQRRLVASTLYVTRGKRGEPWVAAMAHTPANHAWDSTGFHIGDRQQDVESQLQVTLEASLKPHGVTWPRSWMTRRKIWGCHFISRPCRWEPSGVVQGTQLATENVSCHS
jgi:hypothetical protein